MTSYNFIDFRVSKTFLQLKKCTKNIDVEVLYVANNFLFW